MWPSSQSFRDPAGYVFEDAGILRRAVTSRGEPDYSRLMSSGLYDNLTGKSWLVAHSAEPSAWDNVAAILTPERIPIITYPYEWSFSQLRAAALLTLNIQREALDRGMSLKDASPFNVQFLGTKPIFIDTLSFEQAREQPWTAYRQFCQLFLAPLALAAESGPDFLKYLKVDLNGYSLRTAARVLGLKAWLKPAYLLHIQLQVFAEALAGRYESAGGPARMSIDKQRVLIDSLTRAIESIAMKPPGSTWERYYQEQTHYSSEAEEVKIAAVSGWIDRHAPTSLLDLGGNIGKYSRIATRSGCYTVCADFDHACVEHNYLSACKENDKLLLPLVIDLANPSSNIGWNGAERLALFSRFQPEMTLALALIHHLRITLNVPMRLIAEFFGTHSKLLAIELVPKEDVMAQRLLCGRYDSYDDLSSASFETEFAKYFDLVEKKPVPATSRELYLWRTKNR